MSASPEARNFEVIAHRGASAHAPENTLSALREAVSLGASSVEIDIQLSRDGVPVLFHDRELRRKTGTPGKVRDHDAASLGLLDVGTWFDREHPGGSQRFAGASLATLEEVFREFGSQLSYHVELKSDERALPAAVLEIITRFSLLDVVTASSFRRAHLTTLRRLSPTLPICWLLPGRLPGWLDPIASSIAIAFFQHRFDRAARDGFQVVALPAAALTRAVTRAARERKLGIRAWGVRSDLDMARVLESGADGMTTDWPGRGLAMAERHRATSVSTP